MTHREMFAQLLEPEGGWCDEDDLERSFQAFLKVRPSIRELIDAVASGRSPTVVFNRDP